MGLVRYRRCSSSWRWQDYRPPVPDERQVIALWVDDGGGERDIRSRQESDAAKPPSPSSDGTMAHPDSVSAPLPDCMH